MAVINESIKERIEKIIKRFPVHQILQSQNTR